METVLASSNPDKAAEIAAILAASGLADLHLRCVPVGWHCEETGITIEENAILKARKACLDTGLPALGDDTGLFVEGLGGGPGVYTSRYAGPACSYEDNVRKLLKALMWETGNARRAEFRTAAAFAHPSGTILSATGVLAGIITEQPRGNGGFGYDPVFLLPGPGCTLAECPAGTKNSISHRFLAFRALCTMLGGSESPVGQPSPPSADSSSM